MIRRGSAAWLTAVPSAEALRKILGQPLNKGIAISGTLSSTLLELDNASTESTRRAMLRSLSPRAPYEEHLRANLRDGIFFDVRGVAEPDAVLLFIQSAYAGDTRKSPRSRRGEKVRFRMLVSKALEAQRAKRPP
jgi:hypothetical protein